MKGRPCGSKLTVNETQPLQQEHPHGNGSRYVGLDVHRDTISVAVLDSRGKLMLERIIPTSAALCWNCSSCWRRPSCSGFEEAPRPQWLAGFAAPFVGPASGLRSSQTTVVAGKNDRIDARGWLICCVRPALPVFHNKFRAHSLQELARTYLVLTKDQTRGDEPYQSSLSQLGDPCAGQSVQPATRSLSCPSLPHAAVRGRAQIYYSKWTAC